jgi:hypothetical protein
MPWLGAGCCNPSALTVPCDDCVGGKGPLEFQIVLDGFVDGTCTECERINDTWVLAWGGGLPSLIQCPSLIGCSWSYYDNDSLGCPSGPETLRIGLGVGYNSTTSKYFVCVAVERVYGPGAGIEGRTTFYKEYDSLVDCLNLADEDIPFDQEDLWFGSYICNGEAATCAVTAL